MSQLLERLAGLHKSMISRALAMT